MGCIYRRGKTYWIKYYRNGKPYAESSGSDKLEVAKRALKIREGEISQGKIPGICFDRVSFNDLVDDYLTDYRLNDRKTQKRAERCAGYLRGEFGTLKASEVDTSKIQQYMERRLSEGCANATVNRELAAIKRIFNLATRCTPPKVAQKPYVAMLKENNVRKGFIEYDEYLALFEALPLHLKPVLQFAYATGWRKSEILNLQWKQVNLRDGIVRLEPGETKNDEGRTIYMESDLLKMMTARHKTRRLDCRHVFHLDGKMMKDFRGSWAAACKVVGNPGLLFHDLRRSGIRNMIRAGIPERVAMAISGHKTRSVFDRYNIVSQEDLQQAAKKRQAFTRDQSARLQNGYNRSRGTKEVTVLKAVTS